MLMIAAGFGSQGVVRCTAMVPRMRRPVVLVAVPRLRGWLIEVRLTMVVIHFASLWAVYSSILRHDFQSARWPGRCTRWRTRNHLLRSRHR
jgi:hypothetical protein